MRNRALCLAVVLALTSAGAVVSAQWITHPTAGLPRTADGRPDLSAATPRGSDGKPIIAGLWVARPSIIFDMARGLPGGVPYQPWAEALFKRRVADDAREDPTAKCIVGGVPRSDFVPYPMKILQLPEMVVILYEAVHSYRQIFTDGRELPKDPNPAWYGYSVGRWEGDVFVVTSAGFNDDVWLDNMGRPATSALRVTERFRRPNIGRMEIEVTIDDPRTYTRPWTVTQPLALVPDSELLEYICNENNRYFEIIPKAK